MSPAPSQSTGSCSRRAIALSCGLIVLAAFAAYHNSFSGAFIFDDKYSVTENPTIRHLWDSLSPLHLGTPVDGRPVANFSFALSYAWGGLNVWGYHLFNLIVHVLAGLTLFGLMRRTLLSPPLRRKFGNDAGLLALAIALLWTLHPLQTESVTDISQRVEAMMGLFYLLTLYGLVRGAASPTPARWYVLSIVSCLTGMATKEVIISAPLLAFFHDRTFIAGTFAEAWKKRRWFYVGLAATCLMQVYLFLGTGGTRGTGAGFGLGLSSWEYLITQCWAIVHYLRLAVWPHPLVLDYGILVIKDPLVVLPQALLLLVLFGATLVALRRWPVPGFAGLWFFAILAPTSSVIPLVAQTVTEHRMYLPLVALHAPAVLAAYAWLGRRSLYFFAALAVAFGLLTARRNLDYRDALTMWVDTVAKRPDNVRAQYNLAIALVNVHRPEEALPHYREAIRLRPGWADLLDDYGIALAQVNRLDEAISSFEEALRAQPRHAKAHCHLATALAQTGKVEESVEHFEAALQLDLGYVDAHLNFAAALLKLNRIDDAAAHFEAAVQLKPASETFIGLGRVRALQGRLPEAVDNYERALQLNPDNASAHYNVGVILLQLNHVGEARAHFTSAVQLKPDFAQARAILSSLPAGP